MDSNQILDADFDSEFTDKEEVELISINKFAILCVVSFGLYEIWWIYKSWRFFKDKDNLDIMPAWRALFSVFFLYQLFERILDFAKKNGYSKDYASAGLLIAFIILNVTSKLPDPYWLISFLAFLCIIPALKAFNSAIRNSSKYKAIERVGFNTSQTVLLIVGGIVLILSIIGLTVDEGIYDGY
ncbi:MAG: hypothetical protein JXR03_04655 [Cyclobacteriaceae bacterium]